MNKVISMSMYNSFLLRNTTSLEVNTSEYDFPTIMKDMSHCEREHIYICKARVNVIRLCPCVTVKIMVILEGVTKSQIINRSWIDCDTYKM